MSLDIAGLLQIGDAKVGQFVFALALASGLAHSQLVALTDLTIVQFQRAVV